VLDGSGNALVVYQGASGGQQVLASSYFSRSTGWDELPPNWPHEGFLYPVPGSIVYGSIQKVQLATTAGGSFLTAWDVSFSQENEVAPFDILIARFTSSTRTWSTAQTLVPGNVQNEVRFQRLGSDANGNALLLWTESDGMRTALKVVRLDQAGTACEAAQVIDSAVGGGAGRADLGVDPQGNAIAIWQH
jgi:hypothetical protein